MAKIIGLAGKARSGKDTVADYLASHYGYQPIAFADPIRAGLKAMFNLEDRWIDRDKEDAIKWIGASYRQLAQTLGTEWGRQQIHPDLWVLTLAKRLWYASEDDKFIVTDVRFPNEAVWVRSVGQLMHLDRMDAPDVRQHVSEPGIEPRMGEWIVYNNGSLDDLYHQLDCLMRDVEARP